MKKTFQAFTIIELIVVVIIIIILGSIGLFQFFKLTDDSIILSNKSNLKELQNVIEAHKATFHELPKFPNPEIDGSWMSWKFDDDLLPYLKSVNTFPLHPESQVPYIYYLKNNGKFYRIEGIDSEGNITRVSNIPKQISN